MSLLSHATTSCLPRLLQGHAMQFCKGHKSKCQMSLPTHPHACHVCPLKSPHNGQATRRGEAFPDLRREGAFSELEERRSIMALAPEDVVSPVG